MSEYSGTPGGLAEHEVLARLTVEEKRAIAEGSIVEFPHLDESMLDDWLETYGCRDGHSLEDYDAWDVLGDNQTPTRGAETKLQKASMLVACLEDAVESGREPEALDHFIYGNVYPAIIDEVVDGGVDELLGRDPLDTWEGVYDG